MSSSAKSASSAITPTLVALTAGAFLALAVSYNPFGIDQVTALPLLSLALAGIAAVVLLPKAAETYALLRWRVAWAGAAFLGWALVASVFSGQAFVSLTGMYGSMLGWLTLAGVAVIAVASCVHGAPIREILERAAAYIVGLEVVIALSQYSEQRHPAGTLSNSTYLGDVLLMLLPFVVASALKAQRTSEKLVYWAVVAGGFVAMVVGSARAAAVSTLVWLAVLGTLALKRRFSLSALTASAIGVGAALVLGAVGLAVAKPARVSAALGEFFAARTRFWVPAVAATLQRPLAGWGPDGFTSAVWKTAGKGLVEAGDGFGQITPDPHNLVVWIAVSTGVVGLALAAWFAFEVARNWRLSHRAGSFAEVQAPVTAVVLCVFLALTAPTALETLPIFALVLGASLRLERPRTFGRARPAVVVALRVAAGIVVAIVLALSLTRMSLGRVDRPQQHNAALTQALADAWRVDPLLYYRASIDWSFADQSNPQVAAGRPDLSAIQRAIDLAPSNPVYANELANTLAFYGSPEADVRAAFQRALSLFPNSPNTHASLAYYLISLGDMPDAKRQLDSAAAIAVSPEVARVYAVYYRRLGDEKTATYWDGVKLDLEGLSH